MISSILLAVLLVGGSISAPLDTKLGSTAPSTSVKMTNPIGSDYRFTYSVYDENTGDIKSHRESRKDNVVEGRYELIEPDGFKRIVLYTADAEHGFVATVLREPTDIVVPVYESKYYKPSLKEKPIRVDSNVEFTFPASSPSLKEDEHLLAQAVPTIPADSATSADSSKTDNLEIQEMASSENLNPQQLQTIQTETATSEAESTEKSVAPSVADSQNVPSTEAPKEAATTETATSVASLDGTTIEAEVQETTFTTLTVEEIKADSPATKEERTVATESNVTTTLPNSPLQILIEDASSAEPEEKMSTLSVENESTTVRDALDLLKERELKNDVAAQLPVTSVTSADIYSEVASGPTENESHTENDSPTDTDAPEVSNDVEAESEKGEPTEEADTTTTEREAEELTNEGVENRTVVASEPGTLSSKIENESNKGDAESSVAGETEATTSPTQSNESSNTDEVKQVSLKVTEPKEDSSTEQSNQSNDTNNKEKAEQQLSTTAQTLLSPMESKEESGPELSPQRNELGNTEPSVQASSTTTESLPSPTEQKEESSTEPSTTPRESSTAKQIEDIVTPATDPAAVATVVMEILKETEEKKSEESLKVASELSKRRRHISPRFRLKF